MLFRSGVMELLCIPNTTATTLAKAKNEFFRQVNDLQQQNQGKKNNAPVKDISKDYTPTAMDLDIPAATATLSTASASLAAAFNSRRTGHAPSALGKRIAPARCFSGR